MWQKCLFILWYTPKIEYQITLFFKWSTYICDVFEKINKTNSVDDNVPVIFLSNICSKFFLNKMACCRVNRCCCCIDLPVGVRIISLFLTCLEILWMVLVIQLAPQFVFFAVPTCSVGIICHIITFCVVTFGLHRGLSR